MNNETNDTNTPKAGAESDQSTSQKTDYFAAGKDNAKLVYILYLVALIPGVLGFIGIQIAGILGLAAIVGVIFALMNKGAVDETVSSHYVFQFNTFWKGVLIGIVAGLLLAYWVGVIIYLGLFVWWGIRNYKGMELLDQGKAYPNPGTWSID